MESISNHSEYLSVFSPVVKLNPGFINRWGKLYGLALPLSIVNYAQQHNAPVLVLAESAVIADQLENEILFFANDIPVLRFPDWETLPYDVFSPHQDIISERLTFLYQLQHLTKSILIIPIATILHRIPPRNFIDQHSLFFDIGDAASLDVLRRNFEQAGYQCVSAVLEHGEFSVRGNILDIYPMGSRLPFRIEFFDDEIENIRTFDVESQRTIEKVDSIRLLPAKEYPVNEESRKVFRKNFRISFDGNPNDSVIYREISAGNSPAGIEYYLPLFFDELATIFDYLPAESCVVDFNNIEQVITQFWEETQLRFESRKHNIERPLLPPPRLFQKSNEFFAGLNQYARIQVQHFEADTAHAWNFASSASPLVTLDSKQSASARNLEQFITSYDGRILFVAESSGRREALLALLHDYDIYPVTSEDWCEFLTKTDKYNILVYPLEQGLLVSDPDICVISEAQLYGQQVLQRRRRKRSTRDADAIIRNLTELSIGVPVVHEDFGVGRYQGLTILKRNNIDTEFLLLEYAGEDKLYIPVNALHLISRYTGGALESAPLHKLGSGQWERAKRKATEQVRDVAAELLDLYAKREAKQGHTYKVDELQYRLFAASFPFEETPDQQNAIDNVIASMRDKKPMDHLVCGDVGFGKTEVAMRAAFIAVQDNKQVAILCPTTLLTQQHYENFKDRFSDWPVNIESISRFRSKKEQDSILEKLAAGKIDIIIGTHKLIQNDVKYDQLGLVIIDEEHRFGVRQKEQFKKLRAEIDILTLTATPIPRTLNMAMSGIRDLSIIATPPAKRLAIKTFVSEWSDAVLIEACTREIKRGGQIYFVYNDVQSIVKQTNAISELIPEAKVRFAHGQMRERELEAVMRDFYHQRFNILVCTTIIETGIDIPTANTMIINRADNFGLAQLYQLRGRVGRSHHRAYAYLFIPPRTMITTDARKRLEAIESIDSLGTGFTLATHDLEIRGAGELLGEGQSGQIIEIGYTMYTELLERAVNALKRGDQVSFDEPLHPNTEVELHVPALIPENYLFDIHERLILYKRIANAVSNDELRELQVEMIDRFGLLPQQVKNLFAIAEIKLSALRIGIKKIDFGPRGGSILFNAKPNIDPVNIIKLIQEQYKEFKLGKNDKLVLLKQVTDGDDRIEYINTLLSSLR